MRLVVLGAPGAGKGTQARNLAKHYGIAHISTGDILREHMRKGTPIGASIKDMMDQGQYVPDELVIGIVRERIEEEDCRKGYILDGFPRTLVQAEAFDSISLSLKQPLDCAVTVDVSDQVIIERMSGRMVCPECGAMFHMVYYPSQRGETCDTCGAHLVQREDDKAKTVEKRLKIYHERTEPIIAYYEEKNMLLHVNGVGEMEDITGAIVERLEAKA